MRKDISGFSHLFATGFLYGLKTFENSFHRKLHDLSTLPNGCEVVDGLVICCARTRRFRGTRSRGGVSVSNCGVIALKGLRILDEVQTLVDNVREKELTA